MLRRLRTAALLCAFSISPAFAQEPKLPPGITCELVRTLVADNGGELRAMIWARRQGYTFSQIAEARKCLRQSG